MPQKTHLPFVRTSTLLPGFFLLGNSSKFGWPSLRSLSLLFSSSGVH